MLTRVTNTTPGEGNAQTEVQESLMYIIDHVNPESTKECSKMFPEVTLWITTIFAPRLFIYRDGKSPTPQDNPPLPQNNDATFLLSDPILQFRTQTAFSGARPLPARQSLTQAGVSPASKGLQPSASMCLYVPIKLTLTTAVSQFI